MAVNYLYAAAVSTVASLVGLQWWSVSFLDGVETGGSVAGKDADGSLGSSHPSLKLLLESHVTILLLANLALNVFVLVVLSLKSLFFVELRPSETRKVLEYSINYLIYKGTLLPLVVPPNALQVVLWSSWLIFLCTLKMFQLLARDRLEQLNASPSATPSRFLRVYSVLLLVLSADLLWMKLCWMIYKSYSSILFVLLFFEPLSIALETIQAVTVYGFQLLEICERHSLDGVSDCFDVHTIFKKASVIAFGPRALFYSLLRGLLGKKGSRGIVECLAKGSLSEWKGIVIRNCGFLIDMLTLLTALCQYMMICWLHGMSLHLVDAILILNLRALVSAIIKRVRAYVKSRKALRSLDGVIPDASYEDLCAYNDECAICRAPMARAKKLSCNHLFHLACLRSWLDQRLTEVYSCPTCRRPLFRSASQASSSSTGEIAYDQQLAEQFNEGLNQQRFSGGALPVVAFADQQLNHSNEVWRGAGLDPGWAPHWSNPGAEVAASSSSTVRSGGFNGVQMMMRHLASASDNYAHSDASWRLWPPQHASGSSISPTPLRPDRNAPGLRIRSTSPAINRNTPDIFTMTARVREVLPHIPDELIVEDLLRTNNASVTVNNLLVQ